MFNKTIFTLNYTIIDMAEPLINGKLTLNGLQALKEYDCPIPDYKIAWKWYSISDKKKIEIHDITLNIDKIDILSFSGNLPVISLAWWKISHFCCLPFRKLRSLYKRLRTYLITQDNQLQ